MVPLSRNTIVNHPASNEAPPTVWCCRRICPPEGLVPGSATGLRNTANARYHLSACSGSQQPHGSSLGRLAWLLRGVPAALCTGQRPEQLTLNTLSDEQPPERANADDDAQTDTDDPAASPERRSPRDSGPDRATPARPGTTDGRGTDTGDTETVENRPTKRRIYNIADIW